MTVSKQIDTSEEDVDQAEKDVDPISETIGNVGRYQVLRIILVFLISIPGIAHIFCSVFAVAKVG